jgi:hypothetical protein
MRRGNMAKGRIAKAKERKKGIIQEGNGKESWELRENFREENKEGEERRKEKAWGHRERRGS